LPLFIPGIAWQAHLGGFAVGIAVTAVWMNGGARTAVARTAVAVLGMIISYFIAVM
jgi:membrane associated rhomboid family serine protease